jgi:hypothetical protein
MNQTIIFDAAKTKANMKSYTSVIHHPRRLGSGSACERCRSRKTKCDGGRPCAFCASHGVPCIHRPTNRKRKPYSSAKEQQYVLKPFQQQQQQQEQRKQPSSYFETVISSCNSISSRSSSMSSVHSGIAGMCVLKEVISKCWID